MSLDNDLRTLLNAEADHFEPPHRIPARLLRRARMQRLGAAAGTVLGAAAVLVAAVALAGSMVGTGTEDRPSLPANDPPPGTIIDGSDGHAASVVATGNDQGASWTLSAHEDESGLCLDIEHDQGGGGSCGEFKPRRLFMSVNSGDANDPLSIEGAVGHEVDSIVVQYQSDAGMEEVVTAEENFYDAPRQISLPARFFIVFLPRGVTPERVAALDGTGEVIDEQDDLNLSVEEMNPPTGPQEQIATGRDRGVNWVLLARPHEQGPCFEFLRANGSEGGGSCAPSAHGPARLALSQTTFENRPGIAPAFGVAPAGTKELTLELGNGTTVAGELYDAPEQFGKVRFFLVFPPEQDAKGEVVARDGSGEILQRGKLCIAGADLGSSC